MKMKNASNSRVISRPKLFIAMIVASAVLGGGVTEALAKSRHQYRHHHHRQVVKDFRTVPVTTQRFSGHTFSGLASFYGNESGNRTASGQRFNQHAMTAAHRSLPFGTKVKVTYQGRSVVVTINDRGPFIRGRVLDLSTGAARVVGLTSRGIGRVVAEVL